MEFKIKEIAQNEEMPIELLLTADPSEKLVREYIKRGTVIGGYIGEELIAVYVLIHTRSETMEIVNIAVKEEHQGKGYAKQLIGDAISRARKFGAKTLEIGTGNCGFNQLALYQKCGFRIVGVDRDFFIKHYGEPIFENGIQCADMVRLSLDLT